MMDDPQTEQKPPSAQIVGQEFVKQYYTMLNAAPGHLHRFYSNNSSFIHGNADGRGEDQQAAVTGQVEIHRKILSLNFNNCHARICQVDSQSSVGGSVIVQVIGELSNDGQPMRRFVQTFVLAPQTAKKYYVHSDIFRYQDIYFPNAANDNGGNDADGEYAEEEAPGEDTDELRYDSTAMADQSEATMDGTAAGCEPTNDGAASFEEQEQEPAADSGCNVSEATVVTPAHHSSVSDGVPADEKVLPTVPNPEKMEEEEAMEQADEKGLEVEPLQQSVPEVQEKVTEPEPVVSTAQPASPAKPMTWAAMASRNAAPASGATRSQPVVAPPSGVRPVAVVAHPTGSRPQSATTSDARADAKPPQRPTGGIPEERSVNGRPMVNGGKDENGGMRRSLGSSGALQAMQNYPDSQQVFIGNLPQTFTEHDVMDVFEQFGKVLDFRINRKTGMGGNNVGQKNFGFMAFDSTDTVQKVLAARPILMHKCRLNIEERKAKEELAAARFSSPRYPGAAAPGFPRSGEAAARRSGFNRAGGDERNNSSEEGGRTY
jgi:Ras GTPase-activating protein-binding protein 1